MFLTCIHICNTGLVDLHLRIGDQVYADGQYEIATPIFQDSKISDAEKKKKINLLFKEIYYQTWGRDEPRYAMANAPCLMIWDDHEVRNFVQYL